MFASSLVLEFHIFSLQEIITKYGVLVRKWRGFYCALLKVSMKKIVLWKNVRVDDWTAERVTITSNDDKNWKSKMTIRLQIL